MKKPLLFRMVIPAFPEINIFSWAARTTTALGPVMVATLANKTWGWRVEIIDENNYRGPRNNQGLPDHQVLQKENPAKVVGFYCGLSSTIERVWQLADFYRQKGATIIAGSWHTHYCPEESLRKGIDIVVHGDGEVVIRRILRAISENRGFEDIPGISFLKNGRLITNPPVALGIVDLNSLPYPDFGLLRFAKVKVYPIGRIRGCRMNCEFCSVKGRPRWAENQHLFETVKWLVETRKAKKFFIVDDRLEENIKGTIEFFKMIAEKYKNRLHFVVQIRLEAAKNTELLEVMKKAGVKRVCIGYESPIDQELKAMRKGYSSSKMMEWTRIFHRYGFLILGMFIFGYPFKYSGAEMIKAKEKEKLFREFIRKSRLDSIQILRPVPLVGTDLRERLEKEGRVFPLELVPWSRYDGSYVCFQPENMSLEELQKIPLKMMRWFYHPLSFLKVFFRTITFPFDYLLRGWQSWWRDWHNAVVQYGGYLLIKRWRKKQRLDDFIEKLRNYGKEGGKKISKKPK